MTYVRRILLLLALAGGALIATPSTCATAPAYAAVVSQDKPVVLDVVNNISARFVVFIAKRGYDGVRIGEVDPLAKKRFFVKSDVWPAYTDIWIVAVARGEVRSTQPLQVQAGALVIVSLYPNTPTIIEYAEHAN